jgi:hypothetical protein
MVAAGADRVTVTLGDACIQLQELTQLERAAAWPSSASPAPATAP